MDFEHIISLTVVIAPFVLGWIAVFLLSRKYPSNSYVEMPEQSGPRLNVNGLPMSGGVDVCGNPFGTP